VVPAGPIPNATPGPIDIGMMLPKVFYYCNNYDTVDATVTAPQVLAI